MTTLETNDLLNSGVKAKIERGQKATINAPRSEEFVYSRGNKLHVRSDWKTAIDLFGVAHKEVNATTGGGHGHGGKKGAKGNNNNKNNANHNHQQQPKAVIVAIHGLGGHTNRPSYTHSANLYAQLGFKVVSFDFSGHGYSDDFTPMGIDYNEDEAKKNRPEGEQDPLATFENTRCLINKWEDLMEDLTCVLRALYCESGADCDEYDVRTRTPKHKLAFHASPGTPFFLMGTSMGGAIAMLMSSVLHKMTRSNGEGLCGGGLLGAHCDEEFLEDLADGGLRKTCITPVLKVTDVLWQPFLRIKPSELFEATNGYVRQVVQTLGTPLSQNPGIVGEESDATTPGTESNAAAAAAGDSGRDSNLESGAAGAAGGETKTSDVELKDTTHFARRASSLEDAKANAEAAIGMPFIDSSLLPIARAFRGTVLLSPALAANAPHPLLRATLSGLVAPLFPAALLPNIVSKNTSDDATWKKPHYIEYCNADHYPQGLAWGKSLRLRTASTMLSLIDVAQIEIPQMQAPFLCIMDPADEVVSIDGVRMLMRDCGKDHRMHRDDDEEVKVDEAAYAIAASASAEQPAPEGAAKEHGRGGAEGQKQEKESGGSSSSSSNGGDDGEIPSTNEYGSYVCMPNGGHDCFANNFDACFEATSRFFETQLSEESELAQGVSEM